MFLSALNLLFAGLLLPGSAIPDQPLKPFGAVPSERQLKWHEMEMYCLIHFTPTTYQNKEWGYGDADPKIFNPSKFDAQQIANAAAAGGFKGLISVAKHHDGFCLWPTKTTDYSVASSPWKQGKGDMVADFMKASHKAQLAFGVYLSAWDRNDTRYGTAAYADAYRAQLTELMTNYGPLFTSWHDGANGGDGYYGGLNEKRVIDRSTYYAWHEKTWPIVRSLQPNAMIFSDVGPDMRWVGNERGMAGETSWSTLTPKGIDGKPPVPGLVQEKNLTSGDRLGEHWIPAECDVPQRPGWFYHADQDLKVKTPNQLFAIYVESVGRGGAMNLGLAPTPEGILHANDVQSLVAFGDKLKKTFSRNYAKNAQLKASNTRDGQPVEAVLDADRYSYWATKDGVHHASLELTLPEQQSFDLIQIRENIKLGQRLDSVLVEVAEGTQWKPLAKATSIGANRLIHLSKEVKTAKLKFHFFAPVAITVSDIGLFKVADAPFSFTTKTQENYKNAKVTLTNAAQLGIKAEALLDNNSATTVQTKKYAQGFIFAFPKETNVRGLRYTPTGNMPQQAIAKYTIYRSEDGKKFTEVQQGEFANIKANPIPQELPLNLQKVKFLKFVPTALVQSNEVNLADIIFYEEDTK